MGRNLNALLNSAVKERRERSPEGAVAGSDGSVRADTAVAGGRTDTVAPLEARGPHGGSSVGGATTTDGTGAPRGDAHRELAADTRGDTSSVLPIDPRGPFSRPRPDAGPERSSTDDARGAGDAPGAGDGSSGVGTNGTGGAEAVADASATTVEPSPHARSDVPATHAANPAGDDVDDLPVAPGDPPRPGDRLRMIGVERIRRGVFQPRRFFDQEALQELADSLKAQGMIQPVIVRPFGGAFELIAGERRWRAAQIAGLAEIPAIVREMEDRTVAAVSLIENIQREDLNPLEEAQALTRLCDEFGMTHASVAESIGRSRASVSNLMRLLELHDEVKVLVDKGELDMGHARALLRVPKVDQPALAARVAKQGLTVRAVEKLIRTGADKGGGATASAAAAGDPDVRRLEERLSGVLGAPVTIRQKAGGAGRLEIRYTSNEELEGILEHIK